MVNFSALAPEALTLVSSAGVVAPEKMPELSPSKVPEISEAASKPTHFITPGCAHRVVKSWLPVSGGDTVTVADALAAPPDPVQVRLNVVVLVNATVDWVPEVALAPDQPPEAVQEVAFVEDQVRVEDAPFATDVGFAARDTVGGGGVPGTVTVAEALPLPPDPEQVKE